MIKQDIINTYIELFTRGEMLKGENFINNCIPLELQDDKDILRLRKECNDRMADIRKWKDDGRPDPGTYAKISGIKEFPKLELAIKKIKDFKTQNTLKILDIGCYTGGFIEYLARQGCECVGLDIHRNLMESSKSINPKLVWGAIDSMQLAEGLTDNTFDVVTAFDVLEHCLDLDNALRNIDRVCKEGCLVIINLPRMTPGYKDEAFEHLRMFTDKDIERIWGDKKEFKLEKCKDELGRPTSFITYTK